jgi:hypothetical protein
VQIVLLSITYVKANAIKNNLVRSVKSMVNPGKSCSQRCRLAVSNKISRRHKDQCPLIKIRDELKSVKDKNQHLRELLKKHGITLSDLILKRVGLQV